MTVFACEGPRQVRIMGEPERVIDTVANVASSQGTSMYTIGSTGDTSAIVRQGELAIIVSGQSSVWDGWSKDDFRNALHPKLIGNIAALKRAGELRGEIRPEDEDTIVNLVAEPEDILVIFAGGEERTMCAVIPSWGPKVSSTSVTKAVRIP